MTFGTRNEWASRSPVSSSGKMTRSAPTRLRISPCSLLPALAMTLRTPRRLRTMVAKIDGSASLLIATMAVAKSAAPAERSASSSAASSSSAWVTSEAMSLTRLSERSTASTSCPSRSSSRATAEPKRPRPMTITCSLAMVAAAYPMPIRSEPTRPPGGTASVAPARRAPGRG